MAGRQLLLLLLASFLVLLGGAVPARSALEPPAPTMVDDFESYPIGTPIPVFSPINSQPGWESNDTFYGVGWIVTDDVSNPVGHKHIRFHPSPWPGGFSLDSNYAKWHVRSSEAVHSLGVALDYLAQTNGEMKVFISGDNSTWVEITDRLDLEKFNLGPFRRAYADLSASIGPARIERDIYLMFRAAAYAPENWVSAVDRVAVYANRASPLGWMTIYDSSPASFSDWQTNAPGRYYWEAGVGAFHYSIVDGGQDYAYRQVPYRGGSFRLDFDWMPIRSDQGCNHRLGLWEPSMTTYYPKGVQTEYTYDEWGAHMYLEVNPTEGSVTDSWPFTVLYEHGAWYHNVITFDASARSVNLLVTRIPDGAVLLDHSVYGPIRFAEPDRLALSSLNDLGYPGATAEGFLKNVTLAVPLKGITTCGLYTPGWGGARFYLRNSNTTGVADLSFVFGSRWAKWTPIAGDWDGDGIGTVGLYNPATSAFHLRNSNASGPDDVSFVYGRPGWIPIAGDWNGDGIDTVGLYDPIASVFHLRNSNSGGPDDLTFAYGIRGWIPVSGDWDGDGVDTIGLYDPRAALFYLRNSNATGIADIAFAYGPANSGWKPVVGDWDGDGISTIGLYDQASAAFYLRNSNTTGFADIYFVYGPAGAGWMPIAGDWDAE